MVCATLLYNHCVRKHCAQFLSPTSCLWVTKGTVRPLKLGTISTDTVIPLQAVYNHQSGHPLSASSCILTLINCRSFLCSSSGLFHISTAYQCPLIMSSICWIYYLIFTFQPTSCHRKSHQYMVSLFVHGETYMHKELGDLYRFKDRHFTYDVWNFAFKFLYHTLECQLLAHCWNARGNNWMDLMVQHGILELVCFDV